MSNISTVYNHLSKVANYSNGEWIEQLFEIQTGEFDSPQDILDAYEMLSSYERCELVRRLAVEGKRKTHS